MSLARRTALRPQGAKAARWERWQDSQKRVVLQRAMYSCEGCEKRDRYVLPDRHHLTQQQLSEPWRSSALLCAALCRECHDDWHDGRMTEEVRNELLWDAALRLYAAIIPTRPHLLVGAPLDAIRGLIREADADGVLPPGYREP